MIEAIKQQELNFRQTQTENILKHLQAGKTITPLEALEKFRCLRLGGRIFEIKKQGFAIAKRMVKTPSGKSVAEYRLEQL